jgi:hypothetical protein
MPYRNAADHLEATWLHRLFAVAPAMPPFAVGVGIAVTVFASYLAMELAAGHLGPLPDGTPLWARGDLFDAAVQSLLLGYIPVAYFYAARGAERDAESIVALLPGSNAKYAAALEMGIPPHTVWRFRMAGTVGLAVGLLLHSGAIWAAVASVHVEIWNHHFAWFTAADLLLFTVLGQVVYLTMMASGAFRGLSALPIEIDLLDPRPLAPFVRIGLRNALLWLVGISLSLLLFLSPGPTWPLLQWIRLGVYLVAVAVATAAFVGPVRGVHRRIRAEKEAELERVRSAIRGDRSGLARSGLAREASDVSVADLVAYKGLIESVRVWPFARTTVARFLFYLAIPLGSWVAAALVERAVDVALD